MTKKQVRFGRGDRDKARLPVISMRQVDEICALTGENLGECIADAITRKYMEVVHNSLARKYEELQQAYDELYTHHCKVINQDHNV